MREAGLESPSFSIRPPNRVDFVYTYNEGDVDVKLPAQSRTLGLKNVSPLPLTLLLKCLPPFEVHTKEMHLPPDASGSVDLLLLVNRHVLTYSVTV